MVGHFQFLRVSDACMKLIVLSLTCYNFKPQCLTTSNWITVKTKWKMKRNKKNFRAISRCWSQTPRRLSRLIVFILLIKIVAVFFRIQDIEKLLFLFNKGKLFCHFQPTIMFPETVKSFINILCQLIWNYLNLLSLQKYVMSVLDDNTVIFFVIKLKKRHPFETYETYG